MAKNKNKSKKHQSFFKAIKPIIRDNRVLFSVLGALGAGFALGSALGTDKGEMMVDKITAVVKELRPPKAKGMKKVKPSKLAKQIKPAKPDKFVKPKAIGAS